MPKLQKDSTEQSGMIHIATSKKQKLPPVLRKPKQATPQQPRSSELPAFPERLSRLVPPNLLENQKKVADHTRKNINTQESMRDSLSLSDNDQVRPIAYSDDLVAVEVSSLDELDKSDLDELANFQLDNFEPSKGYDFQPDN